VLRYKEKEDVDEKMALVDAVVGELRERETRVQQVLRDEVRSRLTISWIYHDSALEGDVLSYSEIKAATDTKIISDVSLIPSYEEIKNFDAATKFASELAANKKKPINVEAIRKIYSLLMPAEVAKGLPYRRENPLHRLYYHEIAQPDKIAPRMRKLDEWFEEEMTRRTHPVDRAARAHFKLMAIYPWARHSGRVARILSNLMLERDGYPLAIIHSIDRQRYYESLRVENNSLVSLYLEAIDTTARSTLKVYDEAASATPRRKRKAS
jgi:Fic family protein